MYSPIRRKTRSFPRCLTLTAIPHFRSLHVILVLSGFLACHFGPLWFLLSLRSLSIFFFTSFFFSALLVFFHSKKKNRRKRLCVTVSLFFVLLARASVKNRLLAIALGVCSCKCEFEHTICLAKRRDERGDEEEEKEDHLFVIKPMGL